MMMKNKLKKIKKHFLDALFIFAVLGGLVILFYLLWFVDTHSIYTIRGLYGPQ